MKKMNLLKVFAATVLICITASWCNAKTGNAVHDISNKKSQFATPLLFTENVGQVTDDKGKRHPEILFTAHTNTANIYLTATGIHYQFIKANYPAGYDAMNTEAPEKQAELEKQVTTESYRFSLQLADANLHPVIIKKNKNAFTQNFYLSQCPDGITDVASYEQIVYENVYPHIDWVVYSNGNHLKYDFIVRPGGDAAKIKLAVKDAEHVRITESGELLMTTSLGEVREQAPVSYANGMEIATKFKQNSDGSIGFSVARVPAGATLTIDPSVSWTTYYGGTASETPSAVITDASGNVYIAGYTTSATNIFSTGGYQSTFGGGTADGYLAKFNASGAIQWATYFGGTGAETFFAITVDGSGNIYTTGTATSTGLATTGAFQTVPSSAADALIVKFNSSGGRIWCTYYGGASNEGFYSCATDGSNNLFVAGYTQSTGMATTGAYQAAPTAGGTQEALLAKFDAAGNRLWATYFGNTATEQARGCTVDGSGNVYITGYTSSAGMATTGAYQATNNGGTYDAFLSKFDAAGGILWSTYYGGTGLDQGSGCALDASGNIFITGPTGSSDFLASTGAYQTTNAGSNDAFIAKFNAAGSRIWGTFYGGTGLENALAIAVDASNNVIVGGTTNSTSGIASGGFQPALGGGNDAMVIKFDGSGAFSWASYFGGTGSESGVGVAASSGKIFLTGATASTGLATTGAYQTTLGGGNDAYLAQITDLIPTTITTGTITSPLCQGATVSVPYTITGAYTAGNVFTAQLSDASGSFTAPVAIGTLTTVSAGTITATIPAATTPGSGYRIRVVSSTPVVTGSNNGVNITINPLPDAGTIAGTPTVCVAATTALTDGAAGGAWSSTLPAFGTVSASGIVTGIAAGTTTISYTVTNSCGTAAATVNVVVNPLPDAGTITGTATVCPGATTPLTDGAAGGVWSSTLPAFGTVSASGVVTGIAAGTTTISYTVTNSCGTAAATVDVAVNPLPDAGTITGTATVCPGAATTLTDAVAGGVWSSTLPSFGTVSPSGVVTGIAPGTTTISYTVSNSCGTVAASVVVTVNPLPNAGTITGAASLCMLATTTLSSSATGGVWSSASASIANVDAGGTVTGLSAGTSVVSYTVTNSCGTAAASVVVTVNPLSDAGVITGVNVVCVAGSVLLSDAVAGGTWSSSDIGIAAVNATGGVSGIAAGTVTISYTVNSGCGIATATRLVTVNPLPAAISGPSTVCAGASISLTDADPGGLWTSSSPNATAAIVSGDITGNTGGPATITYTLPTGCIATKVITVNPLPGAITGTASVCVGLSSTLFSLGTGTWSAGNANATINPGGTMTGISAGTVVISYTLATGCFTIRTATINALPSPITGSLSVCVGASSLLSNATSGGAWSGGGTHATIVPATGLVTGISAGTGSVTYTLPATGCAAVAIVTVNPLPAAIAVTGGGGYCAGGTGVHIGLLSSSAGINYQLYHGAIAAGSPVTGTGLSLDFGVFTATGTYTVQASDASTSCVRNMTGSAIVTITAIVSPSVTLTSSTGDTACATEIVTFTAVPVNGGSAPVYHWTLNGAPTGTTSGVYTYAPFDGDIVGVKLISNAACALPDSAITARNITVLPYAMPSVSIAPSANPSCLGAPVTYHATAVNGGSEPFIRWTQNGINVATGPDYIIPPTNGDTVYCIMRTNYACSLADSVVSTNGIRMTVITSTMPIVSISAHPGYVIGSGQSDTLTAVVTSGGVAPTYQWKLNNIDIAGATSATYISNTFVNGDSITCVVTNSDACAYSATVSARIFVTTGIGAQANGLGDMVIAPNPSNGTFTIKGSPGLLNADNEISVEIVNMTGQAVYHGNFTTQQGKINETVHLDNTLASGMYILHIRTANDYKLIHFVIAK